METDDDRLLQHQMLLDRLIDWHEQRRYESREGRGSDSEDHTLEEIIKDARKLSDLT